MVLFAVIVNSQISCRKKKNSIFDVWLGYEYIFRVATSEYLPICIQILIKKAWSGSSRAEVFCKQECS